MHPQPTAQIPLLARDGTVRAHATIDAEDFALVNQWTWRLTNGYASRAQRVDGASQTVYLHRFLLGLQCGDPRQGDHKDLDRLNCTRSNLRIATNAQNRQNVASYAGATSAHRGVSRDATRGLWRAHAQLNGRHYNLGRFADQLDAARAAADFRAAHMPFSR